MNEYLNPWYILAETGTSRHVIMMHFGNGAMENFVGWKQRLAKRRDKAALKRTRQPARIPSQLIAAECNQRNTFCTIEICRN